PEPPTGLGVVPRTTPIATVLGAVVVVAIGAACGSPVVGAALAGFAVLAVVARRHRIVAAATRLLPLAALGAAVLLVLARQVRHHYSHDALWPTLFRSSHLLVLFGVLALVLLVGADRADDLETRRSGAPERDQGRTPGPPRP
ncbi:MAG: hypothetical protein WCI50_11915, partial [Actinomycetes bacterium]